MQLVKRYRFSVVASFNATGIMVGITIIEYFPSITILRYSKRNAQGVLSSSTSLDDGLVNTTGVATIGTMHAASASSLYAGPAGKGALQLGKST